MFRNLFIIFALGLLSACQPAVPTREPTPVTPPVPWRVLPVATVPAQPSPLPTRMAINPSPTPGLQSFELRVAHYAFLPGWRFMLTFESPAVIKGEYYALVNENSALPYTCEILADKPNQLRCIGPLQRVGDEITTSVYLKGSKVPVFQTRIIVEIVPFVVP